jgi:hypothetical protein
MHPEIQAKERSYAQIVAAAHAERARHLGEQLASAYVSLWRGAGQVFDVLKRAVLPAAVGAEAIHLAQSADGSDLARLRQILETRQRLSIDCVGR